LHGVVVGALAVNAYSHGYQSRCRERSFTPVKDGRGVTRLRAALVIGLVAAAAAPSAGAQVSVALRRRARTGGRLLSVQDVAHLSGGRSEPELERRLAGILLGAAPRPGDVRTISRAFVSSRLRQEGVPPDAVTLCGEARVAVSSAVFDPGVAGAEQAVAKHVAGELDCAAESVEVDVLGFRWAGRPGAPGRLGFAVSRRTSGASLGRAEYVLDAFLGADEGARSVGRALAWTDTVRYRAAVVSRRRVLEGEIVGREQLAVADVPVREATDSFLADPQAAHARRAARTIDAGRPISGADLLPPDLVRRGGTVTVVIERPNYRITSSARAVRGGAEGDVIPVENRGSGGEFLARVVGENTVVVEP
jgi:flagella basal body P-ring formation protein FlgA